MPITCRRALFALVVLGVAARPVAAQPTPPPPPGPVAGDPDLAPKPISDDDQRALAALDAQLAAIADPADPQRVELTFRKAALYRRYDQFAEALPLWIDIVEHHPEHETASYAADLILDGYVITRQYDQVAIWARYFVDHPGFLTAHPGQDRADLGERAADILMAARRGDPGLQPEPGDVGSYVRCGDGYLAVFHDALAVRPTAGMREKLDEVLYNAGVCYEEGAALAPAIAAFEELRTRFPTSRVAAKALARLGSIYARVARFDEAATLFETYARTYPGERDAYQALNDAVFYRKALGDDVRAIADATFFVRTFGGKRPDVAADVYFSLAGIYERRGDRDLVIKHYRSYLAKFGAKGGVDKLVVANVRIGELLWQQSCPVAGVDGACVKVVHGPAVAIKPKPGGGVAVPTRCGPARTLALVPVARDARKATAAQAAFAAAIKLYQARAGAFPDGDERAARAAFASARFHQAEVEHDAYVRLTVPADLDFDPARPTVRTKSVRRFEAWLAAKQRLAATAGAAYGALRAEVKDPTYAIAGLARQAQLAEDFADALATTSIPASVRTDPAAVDAYCEALTSAAAPLEAEARAGFTACLDVARDLSWSSSWSQLCERALGQLAPEDYPAAAELWSAPVTPAPSPTLAPPSQGLDSAR